MNQTETAEALRIERERLMAYLSELPEAAWDKGSLCKGWRVRDVVAHLVGNAADIVARNLEGAGSEAFNQRQVDERTDKNPAELLAEWTEQGPAFEEGVRILDDNFWNAPYPPFATVGEALARLVEDLWVHAHDIRLALGDEIVPGPGLDETLEVIARELPERVGRLTPEVGVVDITAGGFDRSIAIGDGIRLRIDSDPVTLALVGTGRTSLQEAVSEGDIAVQPDAPARLGDALNIYGP